MRIGGHFVNRLRQGKNVKIIVVDNLASPKKTSFGIRQRNTRRSICDKILRAGFFKKLVDFAAELKDNY